MTAMFRRMSIWRRVWIRLYPPAYRQYQKELKDAIRYLVEHPEIPVDVQ